MSERIKRITDRFSSRLPDSKILFRKLKRARFGDPSVLAANDLVLLRKNSDYLQKSLYEHSVVVSDRRDIARKNIEMIQSRINDRKTTIPGYRKAFKDVDLLIVRMQIHERRTFPAALGTVTVWVNNALDRTPKSGK